jgi:hypothetical protein
MSIFSYIILVYNIYNECIIIVHHLLPTRVNLIFTTLINFIIFFFLHHNTIKILCKVRNKKVKRE